MCDMYNLIQSSKQGHVSFTIFLLKLKKGRNCFHAAGAVFSSGLKETNKQQLLIKRETD